MSTTYYSLQQCSSDLAITCLKEGKTKNYVCTNKKKIYWKPQGEKQVLIIFLEQENIIMDANKSLMACQYDYLIHLKL